MWVPRRSEAGRLALNVIGQIADKVSMIPKIFRLLIALLGIAVAACSHGPAVALKSTPDQAQVFSKEGQLLGTTPLMLNAEQIKLAEKEGRVLLILRSPGYLDRELSLELHGQDTYEVSLNRLDDQFFSQRLLTDYPQEANQLATRLLQIQGYIFSRELNRAETAIDDFKKQYPQLAAIYVLAADVNRLRREPEKARANLLRAQSLDKKDPVIHRMLSRDPSQ